MFDEYQVVRLKHSVEGVPAGTLGAVVMVYPGQPPGYEVEFCDGEGVTGEVDSMSNGCDSSYQALEAQFRQVQLAIIALSKRAGRISKYHETKSRIKSPA